MKKAMALLLSVYLILGSFGSFAVTKSIVFPKDGLPKEVISTDEKSVGYRCEYEDIFIRKVTSEQATDSMYSKFSASQKKYLYTFFVKSGDGNGMYDFHYLKYTGKNGVYNIYNINAKIMKNSTLTISKDGQSVTLAMPDYNEPKKINKTVYKIIE